MSEASPEHQQQSNGLTLSELGAALMLESSFLLGIDVRNGVVGTDRRGCVDISYLDEHGQQVAVRKWMRLGGDGAFTWRRGDKPVPYGLQRLADARAAGRLFVVRAECDAWVCWAAGLHALALPPALGWRMHWADFLAEIAEVAIWTEPDPGTDPLIRLLARLAPHVRVVFSGLVGSPANLWRSAGADVERFRAAINQVVAEAPAATDLQRWQDEQEAREALNAARDLLEAPDLLARVADAIACTGYAGDPTPALLAYVALTSRLLPRPLNLAFVAPSAAGKNRAVDAARALVPEQAYHVVRAASPHAFIYSDEPYQHRVVIFAEADSIPDDGAAASAIRSLVSDGELSYDVVENAGGVLVTRHIHKPGPTGLITTSTKPLPYQMDTRVLTVGITDTPEQTRRVLLAQAAAANGARRAPKFAAFHALQRWLELAGDRDVRIPFADDLATHVPAEHVRMRRDFPQLLTAIQALALLHQRRRERDEDGRIVATIADYEVARQLLLPSFTEAASAGISAAVRETVEAVARLLAADGAPATATGTAVAGCLKLAKDTTWRRIQRCIDLGLLVNLAPRKSLPARLVLGDPLPEELPALPDADALERELDRHGDRQQR